ncbi:MAG: hypothetical protein HOI80_04550, partial [Alphaproteobacteria bacterium]|nr:hypothetical protein [Alphaproteobacteria bacterium]
MKEKFPSAKVLLDNSISAQKGWFLNSSLKQNAFISYKNPGEESAQLLFSGRLIGMPTLIKGDLIELTFLADIKDPQQESRPLVAKLKGGDDLFIQKEKRHDLGELLEDRLELPHWDRTTGALSLSNIHQGKSFLDLGGDFDRESLSLHLKAMPLTSVSVTLEAEWIQRASGIVDIAPSIERA